MAKNIILTLFALSTEDIIEGEELGKKVVNTQQYGNASYNWL